MASAARRQRGRVLGRTLMAAAALAVAAALCLCTSGVCATEPNNDLDNASSLQANRGPVSAELHSSADIDFYATETCPGSELRVSLTFTHASGNLELFLVNENETVLAVSDSESNSEQVLFINDGAHNKTVYAGVLAADDKITSYTIQAELTACGGNLTKGTATEVEPNDNANYADRILPGAVLSGAINSATDYDYFVVDGCAGGNLVVSLSFSHARGNLGLILADEALNVVATSQTADNTEVVQYATTPFATLYAVVGGHSSATGAYTIRSTCCGAQSHCASITSSPSFCTANGGVCAPCSVCNVLYSPLGGSCPSQCQGLTHVDLASFGITSITGASWPTSATHIFLEDNALQSIAGQAWPPSLKVLRLYFNFISSIDGQQWPASLQELQLDNNAISSIDGQQWPANLQTLYLYNNFITSIDGQQWPSSLQVLYLNGNHITTIAGQQWPANLTTLYLDFNRITTIDGQAWPDTLSTLRIGKNAITSIAGQAWPRNATTLLLDGNRITSIAGQQWPAGVREIQLDDNAITSIAGQQWPQTLQILELQNNALTDIAGQQWPPTLTWLHLSDNAIATIQGQSWPSNLTNLFLGNNRLTTLQGQLFPNAVTQLHLENNRITSIDGQQWPAKLRELQIPNNNITSIDDQSWPSGLVELVLFDNDIASLDGQAWPSSLDLLELHGNRITSVDGQTWPQNVTRLYLYDNAITSIAGQTWPAKAVYLYLNGNRISSIAGQTWPDTVLFLNLNNNAITSVDGQVWPQQLRELYLQDNRITRLDPAASWPAQLHTLRIERNLISSIPADFGPGLAQLTTLDASFNQLTTIDGVSWPQALTSLNLAFNDLKALPEDPTWPLQLASLNLDGNPFTALFDDLVRAVEGDAVMQLTANLPCTLAALSVDDAVGAFNCTVQQLSITASTTTGELACAGASQLSVGDTAYVWTCSLTRNGEARVQSTDAFRALAFDEADAAYEPFYIAIFPICFVATLALWAAARDRRREAFLWVLFFVAAFDFGSDWAFYAIEISSSNFREAYACTPSAPVRVCNASDAILDCSSYGDLHDPCRGAVSAFPDAQNECECAGAQCSDEFEASVGLACAPMLSPNGDSIITRDGSCTGFGSLDDYVDETCGYLHESNPDASGANECECYGYSCYALANSGTQCKGWYGGNYDALRWSCFTSCLLASLIFGLAWGTKLFPTFRRLVARSRTTAKLERTADNHTGGGSENGKREGSNSEGSSDDNGDMPEREERLEVGLTVAALLLEDCVQLSIQAIYISVLDVLDNALVFLSFISTIVSVLLTLLFLANRHGRWLYEHGAVVGKAVVFVFTLDGAIPRAARRRRRRLLARRRRRIMPAGNGKQGAGLKSDGQTLLLTQPPVVETSIDDEDDNTAKAMADLLSSAEAGDLAVVSAASDDEGIEGQQKGDDDEDPLYDRGNADSDSDEEESGQASGNSESQRKSNDDEEDDEDEEERHGCDDCMDVVFGGLSLCIVGAELEGIDFAIAL